VEKIPARREAMTPAVRLSVIFAAACVVGVAAGMFGVGGGALLVPLLSLLFGFSQHRAQGTTLVALIPPTGLLAFLSYWKADMVSLRTGLLIVPGVFLGGIVGARLAGRFKPRRLQQTFAVAIFALGVWQVMIAFKK
jgi:uncharacterized protein